MRTIVNIIRVLTGALFIFSGLVKAIDPRGLAYKMQEFFEAWGNSGFMVSQMQRLHGYALPFSIIMITLEVAVGVALLLGWHKKITVWILFLLMLFFTFLTSYVLFSGKIRACGCFGDCIPLTPVQTFTKDIILLIFTIILIIGIRYIHPLVKPFINATIAILCIAATIFLQWYVLDHLPIKDCLPFKPGNDILALRKMPANAIPDKYDYTFIYQKNGEQKEFKMTELPDSSWEFVDRKQVLIQKGKNNIPLINDFMLTTADGTDSTEALLSQPGKYFILFVNNPADIKAGYHDDIDMAKQIISKSIPLYFVTSQRESTVQRYSSLNPHVFTCDFTAIKTAARTTPTLYEMQGSVIKNKWGKADIADVKF